MSDYRLNLPLPPNLGNGRFHWRKKHRLEKEYALSAFVPIYNLGLKGRRFNHITVVPTLYCGNRMDVDNAVARLKWAIDALVDQQVIPDDTPDHLTYRFTGPGGGPMQHLRRKAGTQGLVLDITTDSGD